MKKKIKVSIIFLIIILITAVGILFLLPGQEKNNQGKIEVKIPESRNDKFRKKAGEFTRKVFKSYFSQKQATSSDDLKIKGDWNISLEVYKEGEIVGKAAGKGKVFADVLKKSAVNSFKNSNFDSLKQKELDDIKILIKASSEKEDFSFIVTQDDVKEVVGGIVPVRFLSKNLLKKKLNKAKEFLFGMENKKTNGFHKYYYATEDKSENRVYTVYSSSIVYTLLKIYDYTGDEKIMEQVSSWADFILSMQIKKGERKGAFSYVFYLDKEKRQKKYVSGTAALSIFTLLDLYKRTGKEKYLRSSKLAGDWLISLQDKEGKIQSYIKKKDSGEWYNSKKFSILYNGQSLSALSRLYKATEEEKYYNAAKKIADVFIDKITTQGCYVGDEYRDRNPISSAWIVMSLLDFYKTKENPYYKAAFMECSSQLLDRQIQDSERILYHGRWKEAYSTSGNGWIIEVLSNVYDFCKKEVQKGCKKYKEHIILGIRWLVQNTYTQSNSYILPNSKKARGGLFWNRAHRYIRTDSLCHGGNPYVNMLPYLGEDFSFFVPEKTFQFLENK